MADYCRLTVVGNLGSDIQPIRSTREPRQVIGVSTVCVAQTRLHDGMPCHETVSIPLEISGAARSAQAARHFGAGSRIVIDGHLEQRETTAVEPLAMPDGTVSVSVIVPRSWLVLVVDAIFNADLPELVPEAAHQPLWP